MKRLTGSLAIAAAVFWSVSAHAGASQIGNDYYEDIFPTKSCQAIFCSVQSSSATPAGVFLRIQHFYCRVTTGSTSTLLGTLDLQIYAGPPGNGGTLLKSVPLSFSQPVADGTQN